MSDYRTEAPEILRDFLSYHETIKAHSQRTVDEYYLDLRNFFRYMKQIRDPDLADKSLDEISIMDVDLEFVGSIKLSDIYSYMTYLSRDRVRFQNSSHSDYGLNAASLRMVSSWMSCKFNPTSSEIRSPQLRNRVRMA